MLKRLLLPLLMIALAPAALGAAEKKEGAAAPSEYIELKPAFVTNYGSGAIRFLKADVTLRVPDPQMIQPVLRHMPQIRHALVMLLSRQEEQNVATMEGKEQLRQEALAAVRAVVEAEEGKPGVEDLLFTGFILQR